MNEGLLKALLNRADVPFVTLGCAAVPFRTTTPCRF